MKKKVIISYLFFLIPIIASFLIFSLYEISYHGLMQGLYSVLLTWSMYVLCIPAAHGRMLVGVPVKFFTQKSFFPEPFIWTLAVSINIMTLLLDANIYYLTIPTALFYRILTVPEHWIILVVATAGTWYRTVCGLQRYQSKEAFHNIIRHIILLCGVFLLFYLTNYDIVLLLNAMLNG